MGKARERPLDSGILNRWSPLSPRSRGGIAVPRKSLRTLGNGAGYLIRTDDQRFTKPLLYH